MNHNRTLTKSMNKIFKNRNKQNVVSERVSLDEFLKITVTDKL